jgi:hypothetical protein
MKEKVKRFVIDVNAAQGAWSSERSGQSSVVSCQLAEEDFSHRLRQPTEGRQPTAEQLSEACK